MNAYFGGKAAIYPPRIQTRDPDGKKERRRPAWKQAIRRRPVLVFLLVAFALVGGLVWHLLVRPHVVVLPFAYSAAQGSIRFRVQVADQSHLVEFDTVLPKTTLGHRLYHQLTHDEIGLDQMNPSAEFALGSFRYRLSYHQIEETDLHPHTDGIVGCDLFAPSPGFDGTADRQGARITLDFKAHLLTLEDGPILGPLHLPKGTLQTPLLRDGDGVYYVLLPLNNGASYRFALGIGTRDVVLPAGSVLFPSSSGQGYVNAAGVVPVTLTVRGQDLTVLAVALPGNNATGVLGMSLLANYRVIIDFRSLRLYLEPT